MGCSSTREWLMQAALPEELSNAPARVGAHLRQCDGCQRLVQQLHRLEHGLRDQPLSASASTLRDRFLLRHDGIVASSIIPQSLMPRRNRPLLWVGLVTVAASLMLLATLGGGAAAWLISSKRAGSELAKQDQPRPQPEKPNRASDEPGSDKHDAPESPAQHSEPPAPLGNDLIARLIDMNLKMSDESTAEARSQIFSSRVGPLKAEVAKLQDQDRALAETLVQDGEWLANNVEPLDEADRFTALADRLVDRIDSASDDADVAARMVAYYQHVSTRGISAKLDRAAKAAAADEVRERRMEKIRQREAKRLQKLERLQSTVPPAVRKEIRKLLKQQDKPKSKKKPADSISG